MIKLSSQGITVMLKGKLGVTPSKRGLVVTTTNLGAEKSESIRNVINLTLNVEYMTEENFEHLTTLFLTANNRLDIEDMDRGKYYTGYYITGDSLSFTEKEDFVNSAYYYIGGLTLNKR